MFLLNYFLATPKLNYKYTLESGIPDTWFNPKKYQIIIKMWWTRKQTFRFLTGTGLEHIHFIQLIIDNYITRQNVKQTC